MVKKRDIQQEILTKLVRSPGLKYSEARPGRVENDLFNYHLQFLVSKGLVAKDKDLYSLTDDGKYLVNYSKPINPLGETIDRFKINVLTIVLDVHQGNTMVLNQLRKRHPFFGHTGIMGGPVNLGESCESAAKRKLQSETGLLAEFKTLGVVRNTSWDTEKEVFSDIFFVPCLATSWSGTLKKKTAFGENKWVTISEAINNESQISAPTHKLTEILALLKEDLQARIAPFFIEESRTIQAY